MGLKESRSLALHYAVDSFQTNPYGVEGGIVSLQSQREITFQMDPYGVEGISDIRFRRTVMGLKEVNCLS